MEAREQKPETIIDILRNSVSDLEATVQSELEKKRALKIVVAIHAIFRQSTDATFLTEPPAVFNSDPVEILAATDIEEALNDVFQNILKKIDEYEQRGSGWVLHQLLKLDLHAYEYDPLRASTYIPLPKELQDKHALVNIQNKDDKCFIWCVSAAVYGDPDDQQLNRVSHYREHELKWNMKGISMPMRLQDIPRFERENDISVSVYGFEEGKTNTDGEEEVGFVYPLKVAREVKERHANLLLISDGQTNHYTWIKNFSRLVGSQYSSKNNELAYCRFCLHGFHGKNIAIRRQICEDHEKECFVHGGQRTEFPDDPTVKFTAIEKQVEAPFVVYADFESILKPMNTTAGKTVKYEEHVACSYMYYIVSRVSGVQFEPRIYMGTDAADHFLKTLRKDLYEKVMPVIEREEPMIFDEKAKREFETATDCCICKKPLDRENNVIVRDHSHFDGHFRGAAHQVCNVNYRIEKERYKLPVFFHNLRGYDSHLIMQALRGNHGKIDVIPNNFERYASFTIGRLKFLDSMQFLSCGLEGLAKNLKEEDFHHISRFFPDDRERALVTRKGAYPYRHMDSMEKFYETCLPTQDQFYNQLNDEPLSDADYQHARKVWDTFACRHETMTMKHYHDIYLMADVLLLADVFETFRKMSHELYGLEPLHYYSLPGLSWDAALKHSGVELELITNIDMYQMVEKALRGGIAMISKRYANANHPSLEGYDPSKPIRSLVYLDANSLYPWAMSQPLPVDQFEFDEPNIDVTLISDDAEWGYILEVDLKCPLEKHPFFNDYPLAPEKMIVKRDMLSPFQQEHFPPGEGVEKLVPNLYDKKKYVLHYRNLKLYLELGMELEKIHRVIKFRQMPWLKSYMDLNIQKRKEAACRGDKAMVQTVKLAMNAVFGKTMENVRKRKNIELITLEKIAKKRFAKPNFKNSKRFHDELIAVQMTKPNIKLCRPIQVGFAILDLSKYHMYNFHYKTWLEHFPRTRLLFTDTDSLAYEVEHDNLNEEIATFADAFDFSEYPVNHSLYNSVNRKVVGKFKDELHGDAMTKFIGLRPKLYSYEYRDSHGVRQSKNTAKGVKKSVKDNKLTFEDYEHCLREMCVEPVSMNCIRSDHHQLFTYNINKIGLSAFDDKRFICDDGVTTLAHGHWRTR